MPSIPVCSELLDADIDCHVRELSPRTSLDQRAVIFLPYDLYEQFVGDLDGNDEEDEMFKPESTIVLVRLAGLLVDVYEDNEVCLELRLVEIMLA